MQLTNQIWTSYTTPTCEVGCWKTVQWLHGREPLTLWIRIMCQLYNSNNYYWTLHHTKHFPLCSITLLKVCAQLHFEQTTWWRSYHMFYQPNTVGKCSYLSLVLVQGIQYDKRMAMMEFQLRNFQVGWSGMWVCEREGRGREWQRREGEV